MLPLGSILDRKYDLREKIGEGAMGTVFRATHVVTQQELAVKVLSARRVTETAKARFLREVRLAGALRHRNVVQVVDAGEDQETETLYIVMEHLVGRDLEDVFNAGEVSRREGFEFILQVLPALAKAHVAGIVHRDLKPENMFLRDDGVVKLLDFGVARDLGGTKVTETGTAMGTPVYMSPEQGLRPKEVDHRSDLWSVGVILYEITASFPPFVDESPHAVVFKANAEAHAPLAEVVPDTPPVLAALVDHCLSKPKEGRPADATEIAAVLERVLADPEAAAFLAAPVTFGTEPSPSMAPPRIAALASPASDTPTLEAAPTHSRGRYVAVALVAVGLLAALGWSLGRPAQQPPTTEQEPAEPAPRTERATPERSAAPPAPVPIAEAEPAEPEPELSEAEPSERETESEPAPRLARRSTRLEPRERSEPRERPAPPVAPEPAPRAEPEPEPPPVRTAEPPPERSTEPTPAAERPAPEARPSPPPRRRARRPAPRPAPRQEPEPPPLTF